MLLDIVLLPPYSLRERIGRSVRRAASDSASVFLVDNAKLVPHVSLWHLRTSKSVIPRLVIELRRALGKQNPVTVYSMHPTVSKKYPDTFEFEIKKNNPLVSLQGKVFTTVYRYKTGPMPPFYKPWAGVARKQAEKYGKPLGFRPHITLGLLRNLSDVPWVVQGLAKTKFSFRAREIYVCEVNRWWQVVRVIEKVRFRT